MSATLEPTEIPLGLCQCGCGQPTKIATENNRSKREIKGQPRRYLIGHYTTNHLTTEERLVHGDIPTQILREALERSGMTVVELARALDWNDNRGFPDTHRLRRQLGLSWQQDGRGYRTYRRTVNYQRAVEIIQAMGFDPVDFDL